MSFKGQRSALLLITKQKQKRYLLLFPFRIQSRISKYIGDSLCWLYVPKVLYVLSVLPLTKQAKNISIPGVSNSKYKFIEIKQVYGGG